MRIGYLECFSGISGDMLLGALVDAGVPFACLEETAAALKVGARLEMRKVSRGGLAATKVDVITPDNRRPRNQAHSTSTEHVSIPTTHIRMKHVIRTLTRLIARFRRFWKSFAPRRSPRR